MLIRFLAKCRAGGEHRNIGEVASLPAPEARKLINQGRAMEAPTGPEAATNQPATPRAKTLAAKKRGRPKKRG